MIQDMQKVLRIIRDIQQIHTIQLVREKKIQDQEEDFSDAVHDIKLISDIVKKSKSVAQWSPEFIRNFLFRVRSSVQSLMNTLTCMYYLMINAEMAYACMRHNWQFRKLTKKDIPLLIQAAGKKKSAITYDQMMKYYEEQKAQKRIVIVAIIKDEYIGYGTFVWRSLNPVFKKQAIAHIDDMYIFPLFARQGFGSYLLHELYKEAEKKEKGIKPEGLGVAIPMIAENDYLCRFFIARDFRPKEHCFTTQTIKGKETLVLWLVKWIVR